MRISTALLLGYIGLTSWSLWQKNAPTGVTLQAKRTRARAEISQVRQAVGIYVVLTGRMPASLDDLRLPQDRNGGDPIVEIGDDPWGRPYGYFLDGRRAATVTCLGADGAPGGEGDDEDIVLRWPSPDESHPR